MAQLVRAQTPKATVPAPASIFQRCCMLLVHALMMLVDLVDNLAETDLHLHLVDFQLVDEPVDLVDEEDRADTLP